MKISRKKLINMLWANPTNDKENGYNGAIISLLKSFKKPLHPLSKIIQRYTPNPFIASNYFINEVNERLRDDMKLAAVKLIKDETNLGLKDAKDVMDEYYALIEAKKYEI